MRVTDLSTAMSNWNNLQLQTEEQDRLQRQLSSGKRLLSDADHPLDAEEIQNLRRQLGYIEQYKGNASRADNLLKFADSTLNSASELLLRAIQLGTQGATQLLPASSREDLATILRSVKTQLVSLGNTSYQGQFIFGGTRNLLAPFTVDPNNGSVSFNGNNVTRSVPVAEGVEVEATISGQTVFLTNTDIFAALDNLADAVEQGNTAAAATQVQEVEKGRVAISEARATVGGQIVTIEQVQQQLDRTRQELLARASKIEDADIAQVISQLTLHETSIRATLFTQGTIGRRSLFDFIA